MSRRTAQPRLLALVGDVAVFDKPSGLSIDGGESEWRTALEHAGWEPPPVARVALPLERDASGIIAFTRSDAAREAFLTADPPPIREYLILVAGFVPEDGAVDCPVGYDRRAQRLRAARGRARSSVTRYRIKERLVGHTLLCCTTEPDHPATLRVHMQVAGFPVAVDPRYGGGEAVFLSHLKGDYRASRRREERPLIGRLSVHAAALEFVDRASGTRRRVEAELPKDLRATVRQLRTTE